jgi:hypothetical protein
MLGATATADNVIEPTIALELRLNERHRHQFESYKSYICIFSPLCSLPLMRPHTPPLLLLLRSLKHPIDSLNIGKALLKDGFLELGTEINEGGLREFVSW